VAAEVGDRCGRERRVVDADEVGRAGAAGEGEGEERQERRRGTPAEEHGALSCVAANRVTGIMLPSDIAASGPIGYLQK
jgi:hypothetical protein